MDFRAVIASMMTSMAAKGRFLSAKSLLTPTSKNDSPEYVRFLDFCLAKMRFTPNLALIFKLSRQ